MLDGEKQWIQTGEMRRVILNDVRKANSAFAIDFLFRILSFDWFHERSPGVHITYL